MIDGQTTERGRDMRFGSLDDVKRRASRCTQCKSTSDPTLIPLALGRTQVVFGVGLRNADLMFIGEAPGKDEDEKGEPFVGKNVGQAGRFLDERLSDLGVLRTEVYITNVVLCRPTKVLVEGHLPTNRPPEEVEVRTCAPWLDEQVRLVDPRLIVTLGVPATNRVLGRRVSMAEVHGQVVRGESLVWEGRLIIPTYHPTGIRGLPHRVLASQEDFEVVGNVYRGLAG